MPGWELVVENLSRVPVVAAALGPVRRPRRRARRRHAHFAVMVRGTAQLFVAGPPVVAAAIGETPDKEELGGSPCTPDAGRRRRQRGGDRGRRVRADPALPVATCPSTVWRAAAGRPPRRPGRPPRRGAAVHRPARPRAGPTRCAASSTRSSTAARCSRWSPDYGRSLITSSRGSTGAPSACWRATRTTMPAVLTADASHEAHPLRRPVRHVPPAGRQPRRPARLPDRHARPSAPGRSGTATRALVAVYQATSPVGVGARAQASTAWRARATATIAR